MGGLQKQHNPWLGAQELVHRTQISDTMRPVIEKQVARVTRLQLGSFVMANEMIVPFTHRYAEDHGAETIDRMGECMRGAWRHGKQDFENFCPGFRIARAEVPLTSTAVSRPSILAVSGAHGITSDQVGAAFEVLIMRTNRLLPESSALRIPQ